MELVLQGENKMKLICDVSSVAETKKITKLSGVGILLVKIDFLSLDVNGNLEIQIVEKIVDYAHKHFIMVGVYSERLFHEDDLVYIKMILKNDLFKKIDYFFYSDMGMYEILIENGFSEKTVYYAPTYMTNYCDVSLYQKFNNYVVISNEITSDEVIEIINNSNDHVIVEAFGMACCFYSKRPLVTNYLKFKGLKTKDINGKLASLKEETRDNYYHLVEDQNGVRIFEENHYYLAKELDNMKKVPYIMVHNLNISKQDYYNVVSLYNSYVTEEIDSAALETKLKNLKFTLYKGAYENKTILLKKEVKL